MRRYIVLCILLLAACGAPDTAAPPPPATSAAANASAEPTSADVCDPATLQAYRTSYNDIINRWADASIVAGNTDPAALQLSINQLQKLADQLAALTPPACAQAAQAASLEALRTTITGYQNRMAQQDVGQTIRNGIDMLAAARLQVNALPGQPAPTPTAGPTATPAPTFTPIPTLSPSPTHVPTATPSPTATPLPHAGVLSRKIQLYETATSTNPIKTLPKGTAVEVFELVKGRIHIRFGQTEGWVAAGAVLIK